MVRKKPNRLKVSMRLAYMESVVIATRREATLEMTLNTPLIQLIVHHILVSTIKSLTQVLNSRMSLEYSGQPCSSKK